jgi:hypothetical protein
VTTGRVVDVVGAVVVVVVDVDVVDVVASSEPSPDPDVVSGELDVDVLEAGGAEVAVVVVSEAVTGVLDPGCSLATTAAISAVAPVAATTAALVIRRRRRWARSRARGVGCGVSFVIFSAGRLA